jgi:hypothetical protein
MPTCPKSCRLDSATNGFPAPVTMSTGFMPTHPYAIAAIAWTPPRL